MERAISYRHRYFTEELTIQKAADHIHISRNYFSILFKQYSDQKFINLLIMSLTFELIKQVSC
ncbi:hypothetical protein [Halalkalibacter flavus]|uniref:hypothetical protein n=1 Tax=Halalkalibacter flavus TaxID=3090668 RepID=UPI002FC7D611